MRAATAPTAAALWHGGKRRHRAMHRDGVHRADRYLGRARAVRCHAHRVVGRLNRAPRSSSPEALGSWGSARKLVGRGALLSSRSAAVLAAAAPDEYGTPRASSSWPSY